MRDQQRPWTEDDQKDLVREMSSVRKLIALFQEDPEKLKELKLSKKQLGAAIADLERQSESILFDENGKKNSEIVLKVLAAVHDLC